MSGAVDSSSGKRLLLLRHAKAVPADGTFADIARPLAPRGERDSRHMGERMRRRHERFDLVLASPSVRTRQTAELVATAVGYPRDKIAFDERLYLADPEEIAAVIAAQSPVIRCLLVVGHNPGLSELAHRLSPELAVDDLPTAALVALEVDIGRWADVTESTNRLEYYDFPKNPNAPTTIR
ncbi:MAG TPA: histidine phosphatase family protein [Gammaproteobacteria bacterium]